jgi:hypothetical protein
MRRKLTITVDEDVYEGLRRVVGPRRISRFFNDLAKSHLSRSEMAEGYRAMAADEEREREGLEWVEGVIGDVADRPR